MTTQQVLRPGHDKRGVTKGLSTFSSLPSALLLLRGVKAILNPVDYLDIEADVMICWGVPPEPHFTNRMNTPKAKQTYILLSSIDDLKTRQRVTTRNGIREYPRSLHVNSIGPQSLLHSYRGLARRSLISLPSKIPDMIYDDHIRKGKKVLNIPINDMVIRANQFAARVLLHGQPEDGSSLYPPVRPRPSLKQKHIVQLGLQPYIQQGLMRASRN
ncbi:hypothetical protein B0J17DRAFT_231994 [Rhizoctonia solani]|nr:hypothetical protein B0J17DRAFT_231994 [Rhizoctonia solani]